MLQLIVISYFWISVSTTVLLLFFGSAQTSLSSITQNKSRERYKLVLFLILILSWTYIAILKTVFNIYLCLLKHLVVSNS